MPKPTKKLNEIWMTYRKDEGGRYCIRWNNGIDKGYLTPDAGNRNLAGWVGFPGAVVAVTSLSEEFYNPGVDLKYEPDKEHQPPIDEARALRSAVEALVGVSRVARKAGGDGSMNTLKDAFIKVIEERERLT